MTNGHTSIKLAELPLMKVSANDVAPARECVAQRKFVGQEAERAIEVLHGELVMQPASREAFVSEHAFDADGAAAGVRDCTPEDGVSQKLHESRRRCSACQTG
ncbi:hypothetical protein RI054_27g112300 [Pseudoscourfieldia marina]